MCVYIYIYIHNYIVLSLSLLLVYDNMLHYIKLSHYYMFMVCCDALYYVMLYHSVRLVWLAAKAGLWPPGKNMCIYIYIYVYMYHTRCVCVYVYIYIYIYHTYSSIIYIYIHICTMYMYVCMYTCIYIYIYVWAHRSLQYMFLNTKGKPRIPTNYPSTYYLFWWFGSRTSSYNKRVQLVELFRAGVWV